MELEAFKYLQDHEVDVVFLDIQIPLHRRPAAGHVNEQLAHAFQVFGKGYLNLWFQYGEIPHACHIGQ